jgi:hypothetical protein
MFTCPFFAHLAIDRPTTFGSKNVHKKKITNERFYSWQWHQSVIFILTQIIKQSNYVKHRPTEQRPCMYYLQL